MFWGCCRLGRSVRALERFGRAVVRSEEVVFREGFGRVLNWGKIGGRLDAFV